MATLWYLLKTNRLFNLQGKLYFVSELSPELSECGEIYYLIRRIFKKKHFCLQMIEGWKSGDLHPIC